jgi:hypothetical protein
MAALAHFQTLAKGGTDETALLAAEAVWESGIDPEALAARMAAYRSTPLAASTISPATGAAGSSTRRRANTSGTTSRKPRKAKSST